VVAPRPNCGKTPQLDSPRREAPDSTLALKCHIEAQFAERLSDGLLYAIDEIAHPEVGSRSGPHEPHRFWRRS
jgi:hypothetical protein